MHIYRLNQGEFRAWRDRTAREDLKQRIFSTHGESQVRAPGGRILGTARSKERSGRVPIEQATLRRAHHAVAPRECICREWQKPAGKENEHHPICTHKSHWEAQQTRNPDALRERAVRGAPRRDPQPKAVPPAPIHLPQEAHDTERPPPGDSVAPEPAPEPAPDAMRVPAQMPERLEAEPFAATEGATEAATEPVAAVAASVITAEPAASRARPERVERRTGPKPTTQGAVALPAPADCVCREWAGAAAGKHHQLCEFRERWEREHGNPAPSLVELETGQAVREATPEEVAASKAKSEEDGVGAIELSDGKLYYVRAP